MRIRLLAIGALFVCGLVRLGAQSPAWSLLWDPPDPCATCPSVDAERLYRRDGDAWTFLQQVSALSVDLTSYVSDGFSQLFGVAFVHAPGTPEEGVSEIVSTIAGIPPQDPIPEPAPVPTPTPTVPPPSPDGTTLPPSTAISDGIHLWTLDAATQPQQVLRDGVWLNGGLASKLFYSGGVIFALGTDAACYAWADVTSWVRLGATPPCYSIDPEPQPPPPPPPTWTCTIPQQVKSYANGDKQATLRCPKTFPGVRGQSVTVTVP